MRLYTGFEGSTRGTGSESPDGKIFFLPLCGSLVKIKIRSNDRSASPRCAGRAASRIEQHGVSITIVIKAVSNTGVGGEKRRNRIGPRIRDNPCVLHTVEINILIFSLGRYAHRALLTRVEKERKKKKPMLASGSANRTVGCCEDGCEGM